MDADARVRESGQAVPPTAPKRAEPLLGPGSSVVLLRPRRLRGTVAIVRRRVPAGWEVEIRSAEGTPLHLTLPAKALHLRS